MARQLAGENKEVAWKPALAEIEEALVPAFIIEELDDGSFTVFVPSAPTPVAGATMPSAGCLISQSFRNFPFGQGAIWAACGHPVRIDNKPYASLRSQSDFLRAVSYARKECQAEQPAQSRLVVLCPQPP